MLFSFYVLGNVFSLSTLRDVLKHSTNAFLCDYDLCDEDLHSLAIALQWKPNRKNWMIISKNKILANKQAFGKDTRISTVVTI